MKNRFEWKRCPSGWILEPDLMRSFRATGGERAANTAALMCLTTIVHSCDWETGTTRLTFEDFMCSTSRSRTLIAAGLRVLETHKVIEKIQQSHYRLIGADNDYGWAKFPCKSMYGNQEYIGFFRECSLRKRAELDAMKLLFLFCALRSEADNRATISYDRIIERTGISRANIKSALSLLATQSIIYTEHKHSSKNDYGVANCYRIRGVDSKIHRGTRGRSEETVNDLL